MKFTEREKREIAEGTLCLLDEMLESDDEQDTFRQPPINTKLTMEVECDKIDRDLVKAIIYIVIEGEVKDSTVVYGHTNAYDDCNEIIHMIDMYIPTGEMSFREKLSLMLSAEHICGEVY